VPYESNILKQMKSLQVINIEASERISLKNASLLLDNLTEVNKIDGVSWKEFPYKPRVEFRVGHAGNLILLKFDVSEKAICAEETSINGKVHLDSCVEFFISLDGFNYYNFEFNCIGTPHVGWGNSRQNRQHLPIEAVEKILIRSSLGNEPFALRTGHFTWELCVLIPADCFIHDPDISFEGLSGNCNFYKCGDHLPEPHFLSWTPVGAPQPDFHRPDFFGKIDFE
jgi:hypothetical protein